MQTAIIAPTLRDKKNNSEKTAPQVLNVPVANSALYKNYTPLHPRCIRELRKDPTVQLARWAVLSPMIHTPWVYTSNRDLATKEMLSLLEDTFAPLRDEFLARAVFGTLDFGWQPFEVVFEPEDGQIYIDWFKPLLQDYTTILVYVNTGRFAGYINNSPLFNKYTTGVELLQKYAFNVNFEMEGTDYYGYSVFETLNKILKSYEDVENAASRYDRKIAGSAWIIYYPVGVTKYNGTVRPNDEIALEILSKLEASGGAVVPDEIQEFMDDAVDREMKGKWRIEIQSPDSSSSTGMTDRERYLDALKIRAFGLTERSILEGTHGTKAEADVHGDTSLSIVDTRHRMICSQLNCGPVADIMELNFGKKYRYAASIWPAPLVDNQFAIVKAIYERIVSSPEALIAEVANIDMKAMRDKLGIPTGVGLKIAKEEGVSTSA